MREASHEPGRGDDPTTRREPELLDGDTLTLEETERALSDLARGHRWLFGYRALLRSLVPPIARSAQRARTVRIVDVGCGGGDAAPRITRALERLGVAAHVVGVDRKLAHLLYGRRAGDLRTAVVADARALPFREDAFDWAISHLVWHHFDSATNRAVTEGMLTVAPCVGVVDLHRSKGARRLVAVALRLTRMGPIALADGLVSIDRASRTDEVRAVLSDLAVPHHCLELQPRFPVRFSLLLQRVR